MTAAQSEDVFVVPSNTIRMDKPFELWAQVVRMEGAS